MNSSLTSWQSRGNPVSIAVTTTRRGDAVVHRHCLVAEHSAGNLRPHASLLASDARLTPRRDRPWNSQTNAKVKLRRAKNGMFAAIANDTCHNRAIAVWLLIAKVVKVVPRSRLRGADCRVRSFRRGCSGNVKARGCVIVVCRPQRDGPRQLEPLRAIHVARCFCGLKLLLLHQDQGHLETACYSSRYNPIRLLITSDCQDAVRNFRYAE